MRVKTIAHCTGPRTLAPAQGLVLSADRLQSPTETLQLLTTRHQWNEYHQLGRGCGGVSTAKGSTQTAWQGCPASSSPPKFQIVQPGQPRGHPAHLLEGPGCQSSVHRDPGPLCMAVVGLTWSYPPYPCPRLATRNILQPIQHFPPHAPACHLPVGTQLHACPCR